MMPTVEVNPSSSARFPIASASCGVVNATSHHGIDVHVEFGVFGQKQQLPVEHLEAFLRNLVGQDVVDGDLQVVQAGAVEPLDAFGGQQVAVGDHAGHHAAPADAGDDAVQFGMQQRFAAADGDDGGSQGGQPVHALVHGFQGDGLGMAIVFVAVGAREVAAAHGNQVRHNRVAGGKQALGDHPEFAETPADTLGRLTEPPG